MLVGRNAISSHRKWEKMVFVFHSQKNLNTIIEGEVKAIKGDSDC